MPSLMETIKTMYKPEEVNEDMGSVKHHLIQPSFKHAMKHAKIHQDLDLDGDVDALEKLVPDEVTGTEKNQAMLQKKLKTKYDKEKEHTRVGVAFESKINEQDDKVEKEEMALSQLYFVKYAAEEIIEYIEEYDGEVEEWYQNKLSKVHSDMEGLHSYIEGEKGRLGMEDDEDEEEEDDEDEMDEEVNPPFSPDKKKKPIATPGKTGYGPSAAKHLAKTGLKTQQDKKPMKTEEVEIDEMDKSQPSSSRGAEGLPVGKKADPVKTDKVKSDALKALQKQYKKVKEEVEIDEAAHKVSVTVSDPGHPMVSKRDEKMEKRVIVNADNKDHAIVKAKEFYKKKGLKVHDANYHSPQGKSTMKTEDVEIENEMINEDIMKLDPITNTLVGLAVAAGVAMYAFDFWFGKDDYEKTRKPIERGMDKAEKAGNAKLYHSLAAKYYEDRVTKYTKALDKLRNDPKTFYKKDSLKTGAKKGEMKKFEKRAEEELLRVLEIAKKKQKEFEAKEKSGEPISKAYYESFNTLEESHFKVGQRVECIKSGMKGTVTKIDEPQTGKYYTVKQDSGKMMKYAPDELKAIKEEMKEETLSIEETIKRVVMGEKLHPNQKKLDVDKDGDIEADDLADLRAGKHKKKEEKSGGKEQIDLKPKLDEEEMSDAEMKKREEIVKSLKKRTQDFKDRYGDRWKEVMYATATKMAMKD